MSSRRVSYATWQSYTPAQKAAKKKAMASAGIPSIRGQGAYTESKPYIPRKKVKKPLSYSNPGPWGKAGRSIGSLAGKALAGPFGGWAGEKVGGLAHYIGKIFGSGDYVHSPFPSKNSIIQPQIPTFHSGTSTTRITHREFLGDVISSATANTFNVSSFSLNPGVEATFPWLSQVCGSTFQQYRINGMVFEFRSMSADALNSVNTALGQVIMCTDYDSADQPFSTKQQMENTEFGVSTKPSCNMIHAIECKPRLTTATELYVRAFAPPAGTDIRLYDWGKFYIATNGFQGTNVNAGELWVSYDITLIKAIEQPPGFLNGFLDFNLLGTDSTKPLLLDTSVRTVQPAYDSIGYVSINNTSLVLPLTMQAKSEFLLVYFVRGALTVSISPPTITFSGGLQNYIPSTGGTSPFFLNGTSTGFLVPNTAPGGSSTGVGYVTSFYYDGTGTPGSMPTITFGTAGVFPGAPVVGGNLVIMQIPTAKLL